MGSRVFDESDAGYDALHAFLDKLAAVDRSALSTAERAALLERHQAVVRRLPALAHELTNDVACHGTVEELGDKPAHALADRLPITRRDAVRLIEEAADLSPRRALTGEPLAPKLAHTAAAQAAGAIGRDHVKVIRDFLAQLPCWVDEPARDMAEHDLAQAATRFRPDEVKGLADHLDLCLNPDGQLLRRAPRRAPGSHGGPPGPRRHEQNLGLPDARGAGGLGGDRRQMGRPGHV